MRIYLVRHGETDLNRRGCYYGRTDAPLSPEGREQARMLGQFFREISFSAVVTSPLCRAVETAEIILGEQMIELCRDERLCEQDFGIFEGYTYSELMNRYPDEMRAWNQDFSGYRIPGGESFLDVRRRTEQFLSEIKRRAGESRRETAVLLVAHKGTLGHFLAACLGLPPEGYWNFVFDQGCYSRVDLEDGYAIIRKLNQSVEDVDC